MKLSFWHWMEAPFAMARTKAYGSIHFRGLNVYSKSLLQWAHIECKKGKGK